MKINQSLQKAVSDTFFRSEIFSAILRMLALSVFFFSLLIVLSVQGWPPVRVGDDIFVIDFAFASCLSVPKTKLPLIAHQISL